jgi:hypothetical protein
MARLLSMRIDSSRGILAAFILKRAIPLSSMGKDDLLDWVIILREEDNCV